MKNAQTSGFAENPAVNSLMSRVEFLSVSTFSKTVSMMPLTALSSSSFMRGGSVVAYGLSIFHLCLKCLMFVRAKRLQNKGVTRMASTKLFAESMSKSEQHKA